MHEYPYRHTVWIEDSGRAARRISLTGFLAGEDVTAQRAAMITACETAGSGNLIHPTLGALTVAVDNFESRERRDHGRVFELAFTFVEAGTRVFPMSAASSADDLSVHSVQFPFMDAPKARCSPEPRMCEPLLLANPDTNTLRPVRSRASTLAKEPVRPYAYLVLRLFVD